MAIIVSASPVNRIVIARILRDCGLKSSVLDIGVAAAQLPALAPSMVILEANRSGSNVIPLIGTLTQMNSQGAAPPVILVAPTGADFPDYPFSDIAKMPISIETIRPMIEKASGR